MYRLLASLLMEDQRIGKRVLAAFILVAHPSVTSKNSLYRSNSGFSRTDVSSSQYRGTRSSVSRVLPYNPIVIVL